MALTDKSIRSIKTVKRTTRPDRHYDSENLYLQASKSKRDARVINKSWVYSAQHAKEYFELGLGPYPLRSIKEARTIRDGYNKLRLDGIDPRDHRERLAEAAEAVRTAAAIAAAKDKTFGQVAAEVIAKERTKWKSVKSLQQWTRSLEVYCASIADLPVASIDNSHAMQVLKDIWHANPETASRTRQRAEHVIDFAVVAKYRRAGDNPFRWTGNLKLLLTPTSAAKKAKRKRTGRQEHHLALPYVEVPTFIAELRSKQAQGSVTAWAFEFLVLTAARTNEVINARRDQFNFEAMTWELTADDMKMERGHIVPLTPRAAQIVQERLKHGARPFPLSAAAMDEMLDDLPLTHNRATVHGMRSSFKDWARDRTNFENYVSEAALAHKTGDKVEAAYARSTVIEKRRKLMVQWAKFVDPKNARTAGDADVIPLRKRG